MSISGQASLPVWTIALPVVAMGFYLFGGLGLGAAAQMVGALLLGGTVMAAVHHAEVVAHKVGEPFGTIILALAITVLEVGLIIALMLAGGEAASALARDTVFAAVMLILNGILGICLLVGGLHFHVQSFAKDSATIALVTMVSILVLTLVLPNFTTSVQGPVYSKAQLLFVAAACLILYAGFILAQTVRHRDYFVTAAEGEPQALPPSHQTALISLTLLLLSLAVVVLMAKGLSPAVEQVVMKLGAPNALVGVIIATVVLFPEGLAAIRAARADRIQTSINLALGSAIASIGLTIPAVALVCLFFDIPLVLGLQGKSMVLLVLSAFIVMLALNHGRTNMLYGLVLLVNLAAYVFTVIVP